MKPEECTLVLGVDARHLEELRWTWPTWMRFKPELRAMPAIVFYDAAQVSPAEARFTEEHPNLRWVPWDFPAAADQREKMLSGFVHVPAREVRTPWYLKLDTDVVATGPGKWIKPEWFAPDARGRVPVLVAARWGYSKPRDVIERLDGWGDTIPRLARYPRLNLPPSAHRHRVAHRRIISWIFFGRTDWTRTVASWTGAGGRLPCPSQDTFLFYCAKRSRRRMIRERMTRYGWKHTSLGKIRAIVESLGIPSAAQPLRPSTDSMQRGVIYYNRGTSCAVRLLVSLASLREHYDGPVTILSDGDESHALCAKIAPALGAEWRAWTPPICPGRNATYLAKTLYHQASPYETTLCLDSDTLIVGPVEELFASAEQESFVVAHFAGWRTDGSIIGGRLRAWQPYLPDYVEEALRFGPAINCGVVGFRRDAALLRDWLRLALPGRETFIPDEVCCQIILHRYPHAIVDAGWNRSCKHDDPDAPGTRIIHYHGRKHCRPGLPFAGAKWVAAFDQVCEGNLAGVCDWTPAGDRMLRKFLRGQKQRRRPPHGSGDITRLRAFRPAP
jgi:hypothetical protein